MCYLVQWFVQTVKGKPATEPARQLFAVVQWNEEVMIHHTWSNSGDTPHTVASNTDWSLFGEKKITVIEPF